MAITTLSASLVVSFMLLPPSLQICRGLKPQQDFDDENRQVRCQFLVHPVTPCPVCFY